MTDLQIPNGSSEDSGIASIDEERWALYSWLIEPSLSDAARKAFETLPEGQQFFSESQKRS